MYVKGSQKIKIKIKSSCSIVDLGKKNLKTRIKSSNIQNLPDCDYELKKVRYNLRTQFHNLGKIFLFHYRVSL